MIHLATQAGKADCHHTKPGNLRLPYLAGTEQLKAIYKDNADTIIGNCDTTLFLGGKEKSTLKEMSELSGKETIDSLPKARGWG